MEGYSVGSGQNEAAAIKQATSMCLHKRDADFAAFNQCIEGAYNACPTPPCRIEHLNQNNYGTMDCSITCTRFIYWGNNVYTRCDYVYTKSGKRIEPGKCYEYKPPRDSKLLPQWACIAKADSGYVDLWCHP